MLPAELIDRIIDFLWDDDPTLSKCGQVSKSWLPAARLHLFHTLAIRPFEPHGSPHPLTEESAPYLSHYVHNLKLYCDTFDEAILPFLPKFPLLKKLTLLDGYWPYVPLSVRVRIQGMIVQITYLELTEIVFQHSKTLQHIIGAAEALRTLVISGGKLIERGRNLDSSRKPPPQLNCLVIKGIQSWEMQATHSVVRWLAKESVTLRTLKIYNLYNVGTPWYSSILRYMASRLEHITIGSHYFERLGNVSFAGGQTFAHNDNIRTIHFRNEEDNHNDIRLGWMVELLHRTTSPFLQAVTIEYTRVSVFPAIFMTEYSSLLFALFNSSSVWQSRVLQFGIPESQRTVCKDIVHERFGSMWEEGRIRFVDPSAD